MRQKRHVVLTGEVGVGKSTALRAALALLGARAAGLETYSPGQSGVTPRSLFMRPYGSGEEGELIAVLPSEDRERIAALFDSTGAALLRAALESGADVIAIDECGRLESRAYAYQKAIAECLDGETPVLIALRLRKAEWADDIRKHPAVTLVEVTQENRDRVSQIVCGLLRGE